MSQQMFYTSEIKILWIRAIDDFYTWCKCPYTLCDRPIRCKLIVIFVEDGNRFYFYLQVGWRCQSLRLLCRVMGKHASNWHLTFEVTAQVGDAGHRSSSVHQVWSSQAFSFWRHGWHSVTALIGLVTLTFDLLTSKWGHVLPIFSLLCPSVLDLASGTAQTDRQTDKGTHCIMPPQYGAGHNKSISDSEIIVNGVAVERNGNMSRVIHQNMQLICCIVICLVLSLIYSHFPTDVSFPLSRVTK